jgi:glutamine amidotransferase
MAPRVALIDYGMGNLHSVAKALERAGARAELVADGGAWNGFSGLVLPGVGHFGDGIRQLHARGLAGPVRSWLGAGKLFLGICLGMQMLLERSEEAPGLDGLGVCAGSVRRFALSAGAPKVPQMGWNDVETKPGCPLFAGIPPHSRFYFVHSYYAAPDDGGVSAGTAEYGIRYCAALWRGNMYACQFHPEKSQATGLAVLRNFVALLPEGRQGV